MLNQAQLSNDVLRNLRIFLDFRHGPLKGGSQCFVGNGAACLTDGRQSSERPMFGVGSLKLKHQQTVSQHYQVHMPCLALAATQLTVSHAQILLAVAMKGLRACPALSIRFQNAIDFPAGSIRHQNFGWQLIPPIAPQDHDAYRMRHLWQPHGGCVIPLTIIAATDFLFLLSFDRCSKLTGVDRATTNLQFAIGFQVTHVTARFTMTVLLGVNMVKVLRTGKIAVKRERSGNFLLLLVQKQYPRNLAGQIR